MTSHTNYPELDQTSQVNDTVPDKTALTSDTTDFGVPGSPSDQLAANLGIPTTLCSRTTLRTQESTIFIIVILL